MENEINLSTDEENLEEPLPYSLKREFFYLFRDMAIQLGSICVLVSIGLWVYLNFFTEKSFHQVLGIKSYPQDFISAPKGMGEEKQMSKPNSIASDLSQ